MTIEQAVAIIIGQERFDAVISELGIHWAVFEAMTVATTDHDPTAIRTIREWNKSNK